MKYISACEHGEWHLRLSEIKSDGEIMEEKPYRWKCKSWRHSGECRMARGAEDYQRISQALIVRDDWAFVTLTFAKRDWPNLLTQYECSCSMWSAFRCRINRLWGKCPYIQTWERHQSGGLHVHANIASKGLCRECYLCRDCLNSPHWHCDAIQRHATDVGFGPIHWAEPLGTGTGERMAGYLVKVATELVGAGTKSQIPFDAPRHFRRIRASQGVLPPKIKGDWLGRMVFAPFPSSTQSEQ